MKQGQKEIVHEYVDYKKNNEKKDGNDNICDNFKEVYQEAIFNKIEREGEPDKGLEYFLNNAGIYSYVDSLFN